ncbi:MAG: PIN domain-containing protein [Paracoccaceae bacterium]
MSKAVLDACVIYPPVLRAILLSAARAGLYVPVWSDRILEEWARASARLGNGSDAQARLEAQAMRAAFPAATIRPQPGLEARLHLPDENDIHVLAVAVASGADAIVTFNAQDFPRHVLAAEGVERRDPDGFLWEMWSAEPEAMGAILSRVREDATRMAGVPVSLKSLLKRARLNRLAKAVAG